MKRFLLILIAISCIMTATAQKANQKSLKQKVRRVEQINRQAQEITQKLDSIVMDEEYTTIIFSYDNQFNVTLMDMCIYGQSFVQASWYYDQQNRPIRTEQTWLGELQSKTELSYNNQGLVSEEIDYDYEANETWTPSTKTTYEYNNNGKVTKAILLQYEDSSWVNSEMMEYTYYVVTNLLKCITESDWYSGEWEEYYKTEFGYDGHQNCTEFIEYYMSAEDGWIKDEKSSFEYDTFVSGLL